jgi:hypothetical protein
MKEANKKDNNYDRLSKIRAPLISSIMLMMNFTVHLNVSCGCSYSALQRELSSNTTFLRDMNALV